ncbi:TPA: sugar nucleotidyltransferase [bacterium]|nr:sugar nucleotidyltransferase [bacterium]
MKAIVLAAGVGRRIMRYTKDPKCLLKIKDKRLIERYLETLLEEGIKEIDLVVGYRKEKVISFVDSLNLEARVIFVENPDFSKGSITSLWRAKDRVKGEVLLMDADVYFEPEVLKRLVGSPKKNLLLVDPLSKSEGEEWMVGVKDGRIVKTGRAIKGEFDMFGEWIGFMKMNGQASTILISLTEKEIKDGNITIGYEDLLSSLFKEVDFEVESIAGLKWIEIDFPEDVLKAEKEYDDIN